MSLGTPGVAKHPDALVPPGRRTAGTQVEVRLGQIVKDSIAETPLGDMLDGLAKYTHDPLGFVKWAFPWGEKGTALENRPGPEPWQAAQLERIGAKLRAGGSRGAVIEEDIASGHGVGKSAEVAWIILWAIATHEDCRGAATANTDTQLRTKTWAELGKWFSLFIAKELFTFTATAIYIKNDKVREKTWRVDAVPWSENNTESWAGLHNQGKRVLILFDEASTIADSVWEVARGATTDANTEVIWCRYGNPTRTSGAFYKACTSPKRNTFHRVDARTISFVNKGQIQEWIEDYGEDSDFVRVRVLGLFPRAGYANFISPGAVTDARRRRHPAVAYQSYQKILSCDPARFGDDFSVVTLRQGLKVHWQVKFSGFDGTDLAGKIFEYLRGDVDRPRHERHDALGAACVVYDAIGNGAELDGALRRIPNLTTPLIPVMWGVPAKEEKKYFNQRSECWGTMRDWLKEGEIPDDDELADQLSSLDYGYDGLMRIQLQSKKDIKKNGGKSPDCADSLALSFVPELIDRKIVTAKALPVKRRQVVWAR